MPKSFKLTIKGKTYAVEVGDLSASPVAVVVDGRTIAVDVERLRAKTSPTAPTASTSTASPAPAPAARPSPGAAPPGAVAAPMPGKILTVYVKAGDAVTAGQELLTLEAMKMEQIIRAGGAGKVRDVKVAPGQNVTLGQVLVELEPA